MSAEGIDTAVGWGMPDYSATVSLQQNLPYTVQSRGYYYVIIDKNKGQMTQLITVNGQKVSETNYSGQFSTATSFVLCEVGDIIDVSTTTGIVAAKVDSYCPVKGA